MNVDLAVIGTGAVHPAGIGVAALRDTEPSPSMIAGLRRPDQKRPVLRVDLQAPELARWQREPRLRRASPITLFLIEAATQALAGVSAAGRAETGLIVAFSTGCLVYSRRFFEGILRQGRRMAAPALFPETVFNSPGSHVAATLQLNGAVHALVGDGTAWIAAIQTASVWLRQERVRQVLVLGAEEFDPVVLDAYAGARWLGRRGSMAGFMPAEGAAGMLLRPAVAHDSRAIASARDGFIYRNPREAAIAAKELFRETDPAESCYRTARRTWLGALEERITAGRPSPDEKTEPYLGEASTASAAWHTLRALESPGPSLLLPIWGLNHQLGMLSLRTRP